MFGSRSDSLRDLGGPGRDERWAMIDTAATAFAGLVLIAPIIGLWLYEIASGDDGNRTAGAARSPGSPTSRPSPGGFRR